MEKSIVNLPRLLEDMFFLMSDLLLVPLLPFLHALTPALPSENREELSAAASCDESGACVSLQLVPVLLWLPVKEAAKDDSMVLPRFLSRAHQSVSAEVKLDQGARARARVCTQWLTRLRE